MKKTCTNIIILFALVLIITPNYFAFPTYTTITNPLNLDIQSDRKIFEDLILISDNHPHYGLIGSAAACWYQKPNTTGLKPILIVRNGTLPHNQQRFLTQYLTQPNPSILALGTHCQTTFNTTKLVGSPTNTALATAQHIYNYSTHILILPATLEQYILNIYATPLASYLNIPLIFYENNTNEIFQLCQQLNVSSAIIIGNQTIHLPAITQIKLRTIKEIEAFNLQTVKTLFSSINYLTVTNPNDIKIPSIINKNVTTSSIEITSKQLIFLGKTINLYGNNIHTLNITIPQGLHQIDINIKSLPANTIWNKIFREQPLIFIQLFDPYQRLIAYSSSQANKPKQATIQTFICNLSGEYTLHTRFYHGCKGGFFSQRGISNIQTKVNITTKITSYVEPYIPTIHNLSQLAPYLTAAHGGLIIANTSFGLINDTYRLIANGTAAGPWYTKSLHNYSNERVTSIISQINKTLTRMKDHNLLNTYLSGPAWLSLLGEATMIPMYYYQPSQPGIPEKGLPSDNPYSLNNTLSVGRIISWDIYDTSLLIARTLFYEPICGQPSTTDLWHKRFSFIFGEGFGETGGLFHQIPYAQKIKQYGFIAKVYGDLRNSRQISTVLQTYVGSNYIEYLGHGDWFWFTPSLYGLDYYSKAIDVAHVRNWIFEKPSVFLTSACLMGRIDGIPLNSSIGLTFLHAGCNAFVGSTRETGSEAGLETLENHLIIDNWSLGEALRGEKKIDQDNPTYYVRTLYADPAFNPYEPLNGFDNQGRPQLQ